MLVLRERYINCCMLKSFVSWFSRQFGKFIIAQSSFAIDRSDSANETPVANGLTEFGEKENGGIIMANIFRDFVKCAPNATLSDVAEHFHYLKRMIGADYVGVGGDFGGVNRVPRGSEYVSKYPELFAELLRSGQWSVQELKNIAGLNILRVMRQVEKIREDMRTNGALPEEHPDFPTDNGICTSNAFYMENV